MASRNKSEIRTEIIALARKLFIENGVDATTMEAIAVAHGVSKPTIYEYFENKSELVKAVVEGAASDVNVSLVSSASRGEISFESYLDRLPGECFGLVTNEARRALPLLFVKEGARQSEIANAMLTIRETEGFRLFETMIKAAMQRGECRVMSPRIASQLIEAPLSMVLLQLAHGGLVVQNRDAIRSYFDHYFLMLKNYLLIRPHETQEAG